MKRLLSRLLGLAVAQTVCFAAPVTEPRPSRDPAQAEDLAAEMLRSLPNASGVAVCVGWTGGALPERLAVAPGLLIHILVREAGEADAARRFLDVRGLLGRATADSWTPPTLPYPEHLVNLIVLEDPAAVAPGERLRVLAPGGVAWVRNSGVWTTERKPRPEAFDSWSHWRHSADGNMVSGDTAVAVPSGVRWIASPPPWIEDNTGNHDIMMVTSGGRNFYNLEETITARDSYNGTVLWARRLQVPSFEERAGIKVSQQGLAKRNSRVHPVAVGDALYVVSADEILELDAATGATRRVLGVVASPHELLVEGSRLVVAGAGGLRAYDVAAGHVAWELPVPARRVAAGDGVLFCVAGDKAVCLDLASGRERWQSLDADAGKAGTCTYHQGVLVLELSTWCNFPDGCGLLALSARDGTTLWKKLYAPKMTHRLEARALFAQGLLWINVVEGRKRRLIGLDPLTGRECKSWSESGGAHCTPPLATERFLIAPECHFTDFETGRCDNARMARHACRIPFVPANGLLYTFPLQCECFPMLRGVMALASVPTPGSQPGPLLRAAPAPAAAPTNSNDEWPTYRHDVYRSGTTPCTVPAGSLRVRWQTDVVAPAEGLLADEWNANPFVRGPLTPPVVAGGIVVVAAPDAHRVVALDAVTGKVRWTYATGGRVDTPPTLHAGLCLFGAHDGSAYALDASAGRLVWRYRAAPREARIVAYGQLESPWPVAGSVLVDGEAAYVVAGRQAMSDGGVYIHALRPRTGELLWTQRVTDLPLTRWYGGRLESNDKIKMGLNFKPVDLLVRDGSRIAMSRWRFDPTTGKPQAAMNSTEYEAFDRLRVPCGLWDYGSAQAKYPEHRPAVFDTTGVIAGEPGEVALLLAGGIRLAATAEGELKAAGRSTLTLGAAAVHDGLIAAYGRIYLSTRSGAVVCVEGRNP